MTQSEFNQMLMEAISQGVFDSESFHSQFSGEEIEAYLTKMKNAPAGSTAMDAEVLDIRDGAYGTRYPTAGEAVRAQIKLMAAMNAAEYSAEATYAVGAYCTQCGKLYRCTTAITEAEAWTDSHWTETSVSAELIAIYTALQNKADLGEDGKVPAEQVDAYSQSDSISAETRTALSLPETATPDAALAEIARQLSESSGMKMDLLWENASPDSSFAEQTINIPIYDLFLIKYKIVTGPSSLETQLVLASVGEEHHVMYSNNSGYVFNRYITIKENGLLVSQCDLNGNSSYNNQRLIPLQIYGSNLT